MLSHTNVSVALGGSVKLGNLLDSEAFGEFFPNLRPKAVTEHQADLVTPLLRTGWSS